MGTFTNKCCVCGKELPLVDMEPVFTGRTKYICFKCLKQGNKEIIGHRGDYFNSYNGKKLKEHCEKKGR